MARKATRTRTPASKPGQSAARQRSRTAVAESTLPTPGTPEHETPSAVHRRPRIATALAVLALLVLHYGLAARSLILENPTVDEVLHLPAGVSYWQKGTFRLYHHNPPLVKLVAALPVVMAKPVVKPLYFTDNWRSADPSQVNFGHEFAALNADRYFELFRLARLMMPLFSILGGLTVFAWSRRLYGAWGGLLSLSLWVFCPNILAHARLVTSDLGATAIGVAATYLFWRFLQERTWKWGFLAGIVLGLAQLTKFSMLVLYAVWPFLWLMRLLLAIPRGRWPRHIGHGVIAAVAIVGCSVLTIDAGYLFEGVGIPLGRFEFGSRALTRPVTPGTRRPHNVRNILFDLTWQFRVNRFRGTWLDRLPAPLPEHYILGFDEQKIETEGIPERFGAAWAREKSEPGSIARELAGPESFYEKSLGYRVYLNGELRDGGWWYYYFLALAYKVPEGTWLLVVLSSILLVGVRRSRIDWFNEVALLIVPVVILAVISFLTDINLGLRYVLPIAPYVFIATGKVVPWIEGLAVPWRRLMRGVAACSLGSTVAATAWIHPHYLTYFNLVSGGPDRVPARLIDSNLDWGQDLVGLRDWCEKTIPGQPLGLVYFGQINPSILAQRGEAFNWFLPPPLPGTFEAMLRPSPALIGPARRLTPGYYAVSATALYGLPWRYYDPAPLDKAPQAWSPAWNVKEKNGFGYFRRFQPIGPPIGHSIYIYHLTEQDIADVANLLEPREGRYR
ncbi:MAG: ArnT family glycosyltransferase [Isosphaeraceae bacterium]